MLSIDILLRIECVQLECTVFSCQIQKVFGKVIDVVYDPLSCNGKIDAVTRQKSLRDIVPERGQSNGEERKLLFMGS